MENRCRIELVEQKNHYSDVQDDELHRNLQQPIENKPEFAFGRILSSEVPSNLGLVGSEVGQE